MTSLHAITPILLLCFPQQLTSLFVFLWAAYLGFITITATDDGGSVCDLNQIFFRLGGRADLVLHRRRRSIAIAHRGTRNRLSPASGCLLHTAIHLCLLLGGCNCGTDPSALIKRCLKLQAHPCGCYRAPIQLILQCCLLLQSGLKIEVQTLRVTLCTTQSLTVFSKCHQGALACTIRLFTRQLYLQQLVFQGLVPLACLQ
mmetsp:Transcript_84079/g.162257  ORF Transcript_84079/g.162257 Transcript_84079/m.162257 type:complete len:201 (+) Transcript_84079:309-911(+)